MHYFKNSIIIFHKSPCRSSPWKLPKSLFVKVRAGNFNFTIFHSENCREIMKISWKVISINFILFLRRHVHTIYVIYLRKCCPRSWIIKCLANIAYRLTLYISYERVYKRRGKKFSKNYQHRYKSKASLRAEKETRNQQINEIKLI